MRTLLHPHFAKPTTALAAAFVSGSESSTEILSPHWSVAGQKHCRHDLWTSNCACFVLLLTWLTRAALTLPGQPL